MHLIFLKFFRSTVCRAAEIQLQYMMMPSQKWVWLDWENLVTGYFFKIDRYLQPFAMNMAVNADFRSNEEIMKIYEKLKSPGLYSL